MPQSDVNAIRAERHGQLNIVGSSGAETGILIGGSLVKGIVGLVGFAAVAEVPVIDEIRI